MAPPRELLRVLMEKSEHNPHSLSRALAGKVKQPQIYKFVEGITEEPRRSTLAPVADYYGISVEAFFDEALAAALLRDIADGTFTVQRHKAGGRATPRAAQDRTPAEPRPPVMPEEQWRALSPRTRAFVEELCHQALTGSLTDADISWLHDSLSRATTSHGGPLASAIATGQPPGGPG